MIAWCSRRFLGFAASALVLAGCGGKPVAPGRPSVLFVLVDTLRTSRMSAYGHDRNTTPFLESLATDGVRFENAFSQSPWTAPSVASLFTSRLPSETGVGVVPNDKGERSLDDGKVRGLVATLPTLAQVLRRDGYSTSAVWTNPWVSGGYGMLRGFDQHEGMPDAPAGRVIDAAIRMFDQARAEDPRKPAFVYVHLLDVHEPTDPPPPYDTMFATIDGKPHEAKHEGWAFVDGQHLESPQFRSFRSHKLALYDGAMRYVDTEIERLHAHMQDTVGGVVTVVASDHGEDFWERTAFLEDPGNGDPRGTIVVGHGHTMFRELLHVPLIVNGPGVEPRSVAAQVRNLDVMPTLLGLLCIADDGLVLRGSDLLAALRAGALESRLAFAESTAYGDEAKSLQDERFQLVITRPAGGERRAWLFDKLRSAPDDALDVGDAHPEVKRDLLRNLATLRRGVRAQTGAEAEVDAETLEALKSLGYVK